MDKIVTMVERKRLNSMNEKAVIPRLRQLLVDQATC